jgi:hypothetical protein
MAQFPNIEIPDIFRLSKKSGWNPKLYQPILFNERIKKLSTELNPGTLAYDDFWHEMDYYCYKGYQPKGMPRITGKHFYYLNFCKILGMPKGGKRKRPINPFYRDLDHWLFLEMEGAENHGYGMIITKPRRVGLSEINVLDANYEMTFFQHNLIGLCAGKEDKAQEFYDKLKFSLENVHPAYYNGNILKNDKELKQGYKNLINKQTKECGIQSLLRIKTMFADSSAFEGGSYSKMYFEEMGLFENSTASYKATEPCFRDGHNQFGVPMVYGTGGEIDKGAKGFKEMWDNHEAYNLKPVFIPANYYYPGDGIPDEKTGKVISFFNHETGVTDREVAKKYILEERKRASKAKDTYIKHIQSYPMIPAEVFLKTKGGILDLAKLNFQLKEISLGQFDEPVLQGRLEWVDTEEVIRLLQRCKNTKEKTKIRIAHNVKVKFVEDKENGTVWKDASPINQSVLHLSYKPDIGGCDSYDEEVDDDKKNTNQVSSGCVMAYRCFSGPTREFNKPVGVLHERGDGSFDDDVFYENAVKFAVYWDLEILFEYTKFHILRYFYDVKAYKYIKGRPDIEEAGTTNHKNKDGVKMTGQVKPVLVKMLKSEVKENIFKCNFENIILDLIKFGDGNTDIAMTLGICLLHRMDIFDEITEDIEIGSSEISMYNYDKTLGSYYVDTDGKLRNNVYDDDYSPIQVFHPERDLNPQEYKEYIDVKVNKKTDILKRQSEFEKEVKFLGVDPTIYNIFLQEKKRMQDR